MPRLTNQNPSYRRHKASGQARVTLSGVDVYLGPYGSKQSRREYDRAVAEWLARGLVKVSQEKRDLPALRIEADERDLAGLIRRHCQRSPTACHEPLPSLALS